MNINICNASLQILHLSFRRNGYSVEKIHDGPCYAPENELTVTTWSTRVNPT